jgi:hypothetical protein
MQQPDMFVVPGNAGSTFNVVSKYFVARTRDQFRKGTMVPPGCCGWNLAKSSRAVLNVLHAACLLAALWLVGLLCAQCVFFAAFKITARLASQAGTLTPKSAEVCSRAAMAPEVQRVGREDLCLVMQSAVSIRTSQLCAARFAARAV